MKKSVTVKPYSTFTWQATVILPKAIRMEGQGTPWWAEVVTARVTTHRADQPPLTGIMFEASGSNIRKDGKPGAYREQKIWEAFYQYPPELLRAVDGLKDDLRREYRRRLPCLREAEVEG